MHFSHAANATWSNAGGGGGNWTDSAAWTPAAAPGLTSGNTTSTDTATLDTSTRTINSTVAVDAGRNIGNITFNTTNSVGYTLSGGSLVLSDGGTVLTTGNGTGQSNIHSPMTLQGNYTFTANSNLQFNNVAATFTTATSLGNVTMSIGGSYSTSTVLSTGVISQGAGSTLSIVKTGAGSWQFNGANTFSGGLTVKAGFFGTGSSGALGNGTLTLGDTSGSANATVGFGSNVSANNAVSVVAGSSGTLSFTRTGNFGPSTVSGPITLANNLTISQNANNANLFTISSNITGTGNLTVRSLQGTGNATLSGSVNMTGQLINNGVSASRTIVSGVIGSNVTGVTQNSSSSNLTLSNANTFTGPTSVSTGTLILTGSGSINSSSLVSVASGATLTNNTATALTAPLSLAENATVNGSGSFTATNLTIVGNLTGGTFTTINSTGSFAASGALAFTLTNTVAGTYDLFSTNPASFSFTSVSVGALPLVDSGGTFTANDGLFSYTFVNGTDALQIAAVPEPGTWILVGLGLTFLLHRKPRRRFES